MSRLMKKNLLQFICRFRRTLDYTLYTVFSCEIIKVLISGDLELLQRKRTVIEWRIQQQDGVNSNY